MSGKSRSSDPDDIRVWRVARRWGLRFVGLVAAVAIGVWLFLNGPLPSALLGLGDLTGDQLAAEKTRQEIIKLDLENRVAGSPWGPILALVPVGTAILGGIAITATIWKQLAERSDQLREDREERDRENQRQALESLKRTVENLASEKLALRASAAATLTTFLRPEYSAYHDEVLLVALAKAKRGMEDDRNVRRLVTRALEVALRARLPTVAPDQRRYVLDLSRCEIDRIDLSGLNLADADIAFANLDYAVLTGTNLFRTHGMGTRLRHARVGASTLGPADLREARLRKLQAVGAKFHNARCISARFEEADLRDAEFHQAELQEAHFDGADLRGCKFFGANLNNAYFRGCPLGEKFDDIALRSIAKSALNWRDDKAHFEPAVKDRLLELEKELASRKGDQHSSGAGDTSA